MGAASSTGAAVRNQYFHQQHDGAHCRVTWAHMQGRRQTMEDQVAVSFNIRGVPGSSLVGLFDGHSGSETANTLATKIPEAFERAPNLETATLTAALEKLDEQLCLGEQQTTTSIHEDLAEEYTDLQPVGLSSVKASASNMSITVTKDETSIGQSGSTAVLCLLEKNRGPGYRLRCANVGDSRCIVVRPASYDPLTLSGVISTNPAPLLSPASSMGDMPAMLHGTPSRQTSVDLAENLKAPQPSMLEMTRDHTPDREDEKQRLAANGTQVSDNRISGILAMSRSFGDLTFKNDKSRSFKEQGVVARPEWASCDVREGDIVLMFCDGLVENWSNQGLAEYVQRVYLGTYGFGHVPELTPAGLLSRMLDEAFLRGSEDNMSIVMLEVGAANPTGKLGKRRAYCRLLCAPLASGGLLFRSALNSSGAADDTTLAITGQDDEKTSVCSPRGSEKDSSHDFPDVDPSDASGVDRDSANVDHELDAHTDLTNEAVLEKLEEQLHTEMSASHSALTQKVVERYPELHVSRDAEAKRLCEQVCEAMARNKLDARKALEYVGGATVDISQLLDITQETAFDSIQLASGFIPYRPLCEFVSEEAALREKEEKERESRRNKRATDKKPSRRRFRNTRSEVNLAGSSGMSMAVVARDAAATDTSSGNVDHLASPASQRSGASATETRLGMPKSVSLVSITASDGTDDGRSPRLSRTATQPAPAVRVENIGITVSAPSAESLSSGVSPVSADSGGRRRGIDRRRRTAPGSFSLEDAQAIIRSQQEQHSQTESVVPANAAATADTAVEDVSDRHAESLLSSGRRRRVTETSASSSTGRPQPLITASDTPHHDTTVTVAKLSFAGLENAGILVSHSSDSPRLSPDVSPVDSPRSDNGLGHIDGPASGSLLNEAGYSLKPSMSAASINYGGALGGRGGLATQYSAGLRSLKLAQGISHSRGGSGMSQTGLGPVRMPTKAYSSGHTSHLQTHLSTDSLAPRTQPTSTSALTAPVMFAPIILPEEIEWMTNVSPFVWSRQIFTEDYGQATCTAVETSFQRASARGRDLTAFMGVLMWPGVGTRWRAYLHWLQSATELPPNVDMAFYGFASSLGRVTVHYAAALLLSEVENIEKLDAIHAMVYHTLDSQGDSVGDLSLAAVGETPSSAHANLLSPASAFSSVADLEAPRVAKADSGPYSSQSRSVFERLGRLGVKRACFGELYGLDDDNSTVLCVRDSAQAAVAFERAQAAFPKRRIYCYTLSLPLVETCGFTIGDLQSVAESRWFKHEGVWFDSYAPETERYVLGQIPFLSKRCSGMRCFFNKFELASFIAPFRSIQAAAKSKDAHSGAEDHVGNDGKPVHNQGLSLDDPLLRLLGGN